MNQMKSVNKFFFGTRKTITIVGTCVQKKTSKTNLQSATCIKNQPVRKNQDLYLVNFYVYIRLIIEINKMFLESDVTKLSGVWKEAGDTTHCYNAKVDIKLL